MFESYITNEDMCKAVRDGWEVTISRDPSMDQYTVKAIKTGRVVRQDHFNLNMALTLLFEGLTEKTLCVK